MRLEDKSIKKVTEIFFDEESSAPIMVLEDGSKRYPHFSATGSCWMLTWEKEEQKFEKS